MTPWSRRLFDRRWRPVGIRAAVAVVLREGPSGPEVLLMERAHRPGDPWSGHVSFPGGFAHPDESDERATAVRETAEEVGIDLSGAPEIGRLSAQMAWAPRDQRPLAIVPIVFRWDGEAAPSLSHEATDVFWVPLAALRDPRSATRRPWRLFGLTVPLPAWRWERHVIWGLTRRMLLDLLSRVPPP